MWFQTRLDLVSKYMKSVFGSVVAVAFQIAFRADIHVNDFFLFFKNYFWHQYIKTIQKVQTKLNFNKKKKSNLHQTQVQTQRQTVSKFGTICTETMPWFLKAL